MLDTVLANCESVAVAMAEEAPVAVFVAKEISLVEEPTYEYICVLVANVTLSR